MIKIESFLLAVFLLIMSGLAHSQEAVNFSSDDFEVEVPEFYVEGISTKGSLICLDDEKLHRSGHEISAVINGERKKLLFKGGIAQFPLVFERDEPLSIKAGGFTYVQEVTPMPLWLSIIPPLLVIVLALAFKEVVSSLLIGILSGACITGFYSSDGSIFHGFLRMIDLYIVEAMTDSGHVAILIFSTLIGGIVAVISKNGGMQGVVNAISKKATDARSGQFVTWALGVAIFFDDYANTLVVGNTIRPLSDKLRISREKLSYIVDSTAAPIAAIALITTWIGAELGYIQGALSTIAENARNSGLYDQSIDASAYSIFLGSLQYAYYPVFSLIFILLLIYLNKDFGPMLKAEKRARAGELQVSAIAGKSDLSEFEPADKAKPRMINAIVPIAVVILGTVAGLIYTGFDPTVWNDGTISLGKTISLIIGNSDSYKALLWSSMAGLIIAVMMTVLQRILTFPESVESSISGFKTMIDAIVILVLAWSLAALTDSMYTADFLAQLAVGNVAAWLVPAITFIMSAMVAFSTGSSWGTMAIVYPLMLPLSWQLSIESGLSPEMSLALFYNVTSCVLAGAVLGDHCSPISDTTILSSLATQCDHIAHVRTQMPYALTVGGVSVIFTILVALFSIPWYLVFLSGSALLYFIIRLIGEQVPEGKPAGE